mmetsp:Transcript_30182/g.71944  ORF Transcript_30182/g.71944 Transcript_30182/m.71944 type:complete len:222 (-) Transcript_30182:149-814(-)
MLAEVVCAIVTSLALQVAHFREARVFGQLQQRSALLRPQEPTKAGGTSVFQLLQLLGRERLAHPWLHSPQRALGIFWKLGTCPALVVELRRAEVDLLHVEELAPGQADALLEHGSVADGFHQGGGQLRHTGVLPRQADAGRAVACHHLRPPALRPGADALPRPGSRAFLLKHRKLLLGQVAVGGHHSVPAGGFGGHQLHELRPQGRAHACVDSLIATAQFL